MEKNKNYYKLNKDKNNIDNYKDIEDNFQLEGRNPVLEAINNNKTIDKIFIKKGTLEGSIKVILKKAREKGIVIVETSKAKLDERSLSDNHQGIIAICPVKEYVEVEDIINFAKDKKEKPFIIILDSIKDPHNLGAIIRTANASGAHGIIIPKRRSVGLTSIVSKVSAGAIENINIAKVSNINKVIEDLKKQNIWIISSEIDGKYYFNKIDFKEPIALVIGSEEKGVSKLVSKRSDFSVKIPMYGKISSLNASVASALLMYEVVRQRNFI